MTSEARRQAQKASSPRTPERPAGDPLIDYPFPLRSGQIALLRLPLRLERADAERMAAYIRTLVEPQPEPRQPARSDKESD